MLLLNLLTFSGKKRVIVALGWMRMCFFITVVINCSTTETYSL